MKNLLIFCISVILIVLGVLLAKQQYPGLLNSQDSKVSTEIAGTAPAANRSVGSVIVPPNDGRRGDLFSPATHPVEEYSRNHEELWARLGEPEYTLTSDFSARYSNALQFYNYEQLTWMKQHGYPMPADIVSAEQMSIEQLRDLASSGESQATAMLLDRLTSDAASLGRDLLARGIDPFSDPDFITITRDLMHYQGDLYRSGSPFAGYVDARTQMEVFGIKTPAADYGAIVEIALKGLAYAYGRGDHLAENRALWLADEAGVDPKIFASYVSYDNYLSGMRETLCKPGNKIQEPMPYGLKP